MQKIPCFYLKSNKNYEDFMLFLLIFSKKIFLNFFKRSDRNNYLLFVFRTPDSTKLTIKKFTLGSNP
jgi:hypothetical protein